jgi:hypothetical protein
VPTRSPARDDGPSTFDGLSAERVARLEMVRGLAISSLLLTDQQ